MMDGQSHLQSEDVLVPASVHFDYQRETQCKGASTLCEPELYPFLA